MEILGTIWDWLRVTGPALSGLSPLVMALGSGALVYSSLSIRAMQAESRKEERMRHRIATRDFGIDDMSKEMVEIMLVLVTTGLRVVYQQDGTPKEKEDIPGGGSVIVYGAVPPRLTPTGMPTPPGAVERRRGVRSVYPMSTYYDAINTLLLYGMVGKERHGSGTYCLTDAGILFLGNLWERKPYEEEFSELYDFEFLSYINMPPDPGASAGVHG